MSSENPIYFIQQISMHYKHYRDESFKTSMYNALLFREEEVNDVTSMLYDIKPELSSIMLKNM